MLAYKYENDPKFARIHKRINENNANVFNSDVILNEVLLDIKHKTDTIVINNQDIIDNQDYFSDTTKRTIMETFEEKGVRNLEIVRFVNRILVDEYIDERVAS